MSALTALKNLLREIKGWGTEMPHLQLMEIAERAVADEERAGSRAGVSLLGFCAEATQKLMQALHLTVHIPPGADADAYRRLVRTELDAVRSMAGMIEERLMGSREWVHRLIKALPFDQQMELFTALGGRVEGFNVVPPAEKPHEEAEAPDVDDTVHCCPDCEKPNQFGELCPACIEDRRLEGAQ
jgi:hypothetical protein